MNTIYFIIDAPYGYISNGRVNWLYNIVKESQQVNANYKIHIICRKQNNRSPIYKLKSHKNIKISNIKFTDTNGVLFRMLDKITFRTFNIVRSLYFSLMTTIKMKGKVKENDIVFSLNPGFEVLPGMLLKKITNKKILLFCVMKGLFAEEQYHRLGILKNEFKRFEEKTLNACDKVFSNGYDSQKYILTNYNIKARLLPNGVDWKDYTNFDDEKLKRDIQVSKKYEYIQQISKGKKVIMQVGSISEYKGIDYFLSAISILKKQREDFVVILIGKGADNSHYQKRIIEEKLKENVFLINEIPSEYVKNFLSLADIVTNLSVFGIGISMATLESLAIGRINIAWDNIIYNQFLSQNEVVFVENKNITELADNLDEALSEPEKFSEVIKRGKKKAQEYDWKNIYQKLVDEIIVI